MEEHVIIQQVDRAIGVTGLLVRVGCYALLGSFANGFGLGPTVLTGVLVGDLAGSLVNLLWHGRDDLAQAFAELALLGLVFLWVRHDLAWPTDPPTRAILGLAALGVFATRTGGSLLTRFGTDENGFG